MSGIKSLFSLFAVLAGCAVSNGSITGAPISEQDFPDAWADAWCDRAYECAQGDFEDDWSDHDSCVADKSDDAEFASDWSDLLCGDYDEDGADSCLSAIRAGSCDDWSDEEWKNECQAVYGC